MYSYVEYRKYSIVYRVEWCAIRNVHHSVQWRVLQSIVNIVEQCGVKKCISQLREWNSVRHIISTFYYVEVYTI